MRHVPVRYLILLFAAFAALSFAASVTDITEPEARLLWIVRDPEKIEPAAVGDTVRLIGRNVRVMLDRAETGDLPLAAPLDAWTMLVGGSVFAARLPVIFAALLILALSARIFRRVDPRAPLVIGAVGLILGLFSLLGAASPIAESAAAYRVERTPDEPVVTLFRDDSPLGYHHAQHDLRRGVGIDLGWRDFSEAEIARLLENLGGQPVWLIGQDGTVETLLFASGRADMWRQGSGSFTISRFETQAPPPAN